MSLEKRFMSRSNWPRVIDREYVHMLCNDSEFSGAIGLIYLKSTANFRAITYDKTCVTIIDNGYYWLQLAPKNKNYWLTVMYNQECEIVQYYFDMTDGNNILDNGESWFYDMYLDVVILSDGSLFLLDEDELSQALDEKEITKDQYDKAYLTANTIIKKFDGNIDNLTDFCNHFFNILKSKLTMK
ncbi:MAG: DUF402 domain-containing protein [Clostridiales bacterium]|jgi:predicted RNA-binding protein associated with RNAse of E/G family|nr:DUF402 domain-containing protein [Clostridiales bacterium]